MSDVKHYQHSAEAIDKIKEIVEETDIGMLCTNLTDMPISTCPMSMQQVEENGDIWFFSSGDSNHNQDIRKDNRVQLIYSNPSKYSFLSIYGTAEILYDRQKIDELWDSIEKVWFPNGKDDPNLTLLRFTPEQGYYWDTKSSKMVGFLKMAASLVTEKTMDDSVQGKIKV